MPSILTLARDVRRRTSLRALVATSALVAAVLVPSVDAHALAAPSNLQPPTLDAAPAVGSFLAPTPGSWSGSPTSFSYQLLRCRGGGGAADGSNCTMVGPPTPDIRPLELESRDVGYSFRVRVTATNAAGSASVVSAASHQTLVANINITGCPPVNSAGVINIDTISPPARLEIKAHTSTPAVITRSTQRITLRF